MCNRSYRSLWDRITTKEKEEGVRGQQRDGRREVREKARECPCTTEEKRRQRGESRGSDALTQLCDTLKGMCWLREVVRLSQMTSASPLNTIGLEV